MPATCSAHGCTNRAKAGSGLHFFRFPMNDQHKLELWVKAVGRKGFIPNKNSRLCHEHFKTSNFYDNPGGSYKLTLKSDSVPSIFQLSIHSTLIHTKLFYSGPPLKKNKTDNPATALCTISDETYQKTEDLVVEEIVDNGFEFEQAIPLLTTPCYASCSLINDTNLTSDDQDLVIEEVVDDAFEQTKVLLRTPSKYKCKNRMMYTASPQKCTANAGADWGENSARENTKVPAHLLNLANIYY